MNILHDILVEDTIHWKALKSTLSKQVVKLKTIKQAYHSSLNSTKMNAYIRFTQTRCINLRQFQHKSEGQWTEHDTLIKWKRYLEESYSLIDYKTKVVLKMECKMTASIRKIYTSKFGTSVRLPFKQHYVNQIYEITKVMTNIENIRQSIRTEIVLG